MKTSHKLTIKDFAQIRKVEIEFGDLTVLTGAQGTGKSLALQWLKAALDGRHVFASLRDAGQTAQNASEMIEMIFGIGMGPGWTSKSSVTFDGKTINPTTLKQRGSEEESVFFIPAHRALLISDGWAMPFQRLNSDMPVVARMFSQNLFDRFNSIREGDLFPLDRVLKKEYRDLIDDAVFHGGKIRLEQDAQRAKRLKMTHGDSSLPFMTWTAGQREFAPMLLGLYHLLPGQQKLKRPEIDWVIIEEPEMGLHSQAISVFLLLVLDLLWRGYRVVLSTHSNHVLAAIWMIQRLKENGADGKSLSQAFGVSGSSEMKKVTKTALEKSYRVHHLSYDAKNEVISKDISLLDPDAAESEEYGWGGLADFQSEFGRAVREAVNRNPSP